MWIELAQRLRRAQVSRHRPEVGHSAEEARLYRLYTVAGTWKSWKVRPVDWLAARWTLNDPKQLVRAGTAEALQ
jgi:hypothetical protein